MNGKKFELSDSVETLAHNRLLVGHDTRVFLKHGKVHSAKVTTILQLSTPHAYK
jgi:hypothetical protein